MQHILLFLLIITSHLPFFSFGGLSASLPLGALLILYLTSRKSSSVTNVSHNTRYLGLFVLVSIVSTSFSPLMNFSSWYMILQMLYWFILANIVCNTYPTIDIRYLGKASLFIIFCIAIYTYKFKESGPLSENELSYSLVCLWPLGLVLFKKSFGRVLYVLFCLMVSFLNGSRTGLLLMLLQVVFLFMLYKGVTINKVFRWALPLLVVGMLFSFQPIRSKIAEHIAPYSIEMAIIIEDPEIVFLADKSWAQRVLQRQKCKQVVAEYPLFGIGPGKVKEYGVSINISTKELDKIDEQVLNYELGHSDFRSAHNAYYQLAAETGCVGLALILIFFFLLAKRLYLNSYTSLWDKLVLVSFVGFVINLYMVSSFLGTHTWVLMGLYAGCARQMLVKCSKS